jgi:hypothetical protein
MQVGQLEFFKESMDMGRSLRLRPTCSMIKDDNLF